MERPQTVEIRDPVKIPVDIFNFDTSYLIILAMFEEFIRIEYLRISNSEIFDDYIRKYIKRLKDKNITREQLLKILPKDKSVLKSRFIKAISHVDITFGNEKKRHRKKNNFLSFIFFY